jgi:hypothetical protein
MLVKGRCHCGEIKFEAVVDPDNTRICHCTDCQTLSGSPFRVVIAVEESNFELLSGKPKVYVKVSESGNERQQKFCATCGTPIYATSNDPGPRKLGIRVGALESRDKLIPKRQFWAKSAVSWLTRVQTQSAY